MIAVEYFTSADGLKLNFQTSQGELGTITENDTDKVDSLLEMVSTHYLGCIERLEVIYRVKMDNKPSKQVAFENFKMARRFGKCNFGVLDHISDIDEQGNLHLERVHCPLRGECKDENIICNPQINTGLHRRELEVVRLICNGNTDEQIAKQLFISVYTAENHRKNILRKLNLHSKAEIVKWAYENGQASDKSL